MLTAVSQTPRLTFAMRLYDALIATRNLLVPVATLAGVFAGSYVCSFSYGLALVTRMVRFCLYISFPC